jgi:uncharacterized membrane-anchored protein YitT (DUF2179 family)
VALAFVVDYILNPAGLYSIGVTGISQGLSYTTKQVALNNNWTDPAQIQSVVF